jgi:pimeloyl-ACP methyl ester carboxylesterase
MSNVNLSETAPTQLQDIGGVSLAYRHFGKEGAPPVVCFQHFTGTINNFDPIHTNRLAQDRPVILVDYRGVGRSGGEMPDSMPAVAADIIAFVKALGLKEIDLFGFSIGGMVAQQVVLDAPELVRRILLAGTGPSGDALNATTIGGWTPGGMRARIALVAETIWAMARSRLTSGWK